MAKRRVVLVGWDAADWRVIRPLMDAGKMPNVQHLVETGATGQIATLHPPLSPMLWTSIATGVRPFKHGILGFSEPTADGSGVQPVTNLSRKVKALWNILSQSDLRSVVIGWWPSHPSEPINGAMVSDRYHRAYRPIDEPWPLAPGVVHPADLADTLAGLRVHPDCLTPRMVERFVPLAREIDQEMDKRLSMLLRTLAECLTIQSAASWLIQNQNWDFFAVYFEALDHFCHGFMRYHPPRQSWIAERDFELYQNVVAMAYQLHDEMLGTLVEKAGEDATVILMSDHGFHPDHLRPSAIPDIPAGPAIEHRDFGVLAMSGPGIKHRELLQGASVLDVAPTILTLFGLPLGDDMDGKVLSRAFVEAPKIAFIPSWEDVPGADGRHPLRTRMDPVESHEALEQLIALGYIERPDENREIAVRKTVRELRYNLGEAYQDAGRHKEARDLFAELYEADDDDPRFAVRLFVSLQALGLREEMRRIVDHLESRNSPVADYLHARLLIDDERYEDALAMFERVGTAKRVRPGVFLETAELYHRLGRWQEAQQVYEKALAIDPDDARAYTGLCRIALAKRKFDVAAQAALEAVERTYHDPVAHFLLGRALAGMKQYARAAEAFRTAISYNPNFPEAHIRLAALLEKHLSDTKSAAEHRLMARRMRNPTHEDGGIGEAQCAQARGSEMTHGEESVIVVTGLPRSGTSLLMQMLAAGGVSLLSDGLREADEDNPRGYFEYEPVKRLLKNAAWLFDARGKAIKIVAPLVTALPEGLPCRVILCERDLDEVLDSQDRMLARRNQPATTPERRRVLRNQFMRALERVKRTLACRPNTGLLRIEHRAVISDPVATAEKLKGFLGGELDVARMAGAVDPTLYRNRTAVFKTTGCSSPPKR